MIAFHEFISTRSIERILNRNFGAVREQVGWSRQLSVGLAGAEKSLSKRSKNYLNSQAEHK